MRYLVLVLFFFSSMAQAGTVYFLSQADTLVNANFTHITSDAAIDTGDNVTVSASADDECGKYWDGDSFENSSTFTAGELTTEHLVILSSGTYYNNFLIWPTAATTADQVLTNVAVYLEDPADDGECSQDGKLMTKYSGTTP